MTSTERLSSLLYERGIEYDDESYLGSVFWGNASYEQFGDGHTRLIVEDATPEQAIAATVGAGTCTMDGQYGNYRCSNCGKSWQLGCVRPKEQSWKYCPHCGAQIIEEATE